MHQNFWTKFRNSGHSVVACLVAWMISTPYKKCRGYPNCTSLMLCSTTPWNYVWGLQRQCWLSCGVFLKSISFILMMGFRGKTKKEIFSCFRVSNTIMSQKRIITKVRVAVVVVLLGDSSFIPANWGS